MQDACRRGNLEQVKGFVAIDSRRAVQKDDKGVTPLHRAAGFNHVEIAEFLIEHKADPNATDRYGEAPLKRASYDGHADVAQVLLYAGADVNHEDNGGKAAIHHAAEQGRSQVLEALVEAGAMVNHETREYYTPLHLCAQNGHAYCCRVLVAAGAFVDTQGGHQNSTPLHLAAGGGHTQAARILIEEGADLTLLDKQGRRPALLAKDSKTRDLFDSVLLVRSCHAAACTAEGPGLSGTLTATDNAMFVIQPRDRYGAPLMDPGGFLEFSVEVQDLHSGALSGASVTTHDKLCASVCHYDASRAGKYLVHVRLDNGMTEGLSEGLTRQPVMGSPFSVEVVAAPMDAYATRAEGVGLCKPPAGQVARFVVRGRDRFNNPSPGGSISVYQAPRNMTPMDLTVVDAGDGDYHVSYTAPPESGRVALSVAVEGGVHIYNSPFTVFVMPGPVDTNTSDCDGRGVVRAGVSLDTQFMIHPRDSAGNHLIYGGLKWTVKVSPDQQEQTGLAARVIVDVEDRGDGCYVCTYRPQQACVHSVRIMLDNKHVKGSPYKVKVLEMPEWSCEEVCDMFAQNALREFCDAAMSRDIRGFMLPDMTAEIMDSELGIKTKVQQNKLTMCVKRWMAVDNLEWDDYQYPDEHMLVQMGVNGERCRWRVSEVIAESDMQAGLAGFADGEDFINNRLQSDLYCHGEHLGEELRQSIEAIMSLASQSLLTDLSNGKIKDGFGISRALNNLEVHLKKDLIAKVRKATLPEDAEGEEDWGD